MEWESDERELKAAGAVPLGGGRVGFLIGGWEIETAKRSILNSSLLQQWEEKLQTTHLPEMVFALPPVEVPAAALWKFRCQPTDQVILDYDYTFTTPYSGSAGVEKSPESGRGPPGESICSPHWEDCEEQIDMVALSAKESILFYDEVVLYEDELADNGISLLTVKVRVMPSGWFLLLRFWLRVDGVLMRLRDTRMHCSFRESTEPVILREICWREATFKALSSKGYPTDSAAYSDPGIISEKLPMAMRKTQKLIVK
ncbi:TIP41-like protein [Salvia divinorum]|uniref:TIP41-like protein n=1 Tax=Salvia divinorum TaxID=28513 RepID=A0ABD1I745_SALDI